MFVLLPAKISDSGSTTTVPGLFDILARIWKAETAGMSSITMKTNHPAYKLILDLAPTDTLLRLILRDLRVAPAHWFPALKRLAGSSPVPLQHRGNVAEMRRAWLHWGKAQGHLD